MPLADYLRHQAENCLRIGRAAFDLATAERLRYMAAELRAKADEIEDQHEAPAHHADNDQSAERKHN